MLSFVAKGRLEERTRFQRVFYALLKLIHLTEAKMASSRILINVCFALPAKSRFTQNKRQMSN
jgi:hypothetical protein